MEQKKIAWVPRHISFWKIFIVKSPKTDVIKQDSYQFASSNQGKQTKDWLKENAAIKCKEKKIR